MGIIGNAFNFMGGNFIAFKQEFPVALGQSTFLYVTHSKEQPL